MRISNRISRLSGRISKMTFNLKVLLFLIIIAIVVAFYINTSQEKINKTPDNFTYIQPPPIARKSIIPEPIREYNPDNNQQIGILTSDAGVVLPLYGKQKRNGNNKYVYYTMSAGNQTYPVPLMHNGRNCMDLGCQEFFGNEKVSTVGSDKIYNVELYGLKDLFY